MRSTRLVLLICGVCGGASQATRGAKAEGAKPAARRGGRGLAVRMYWSHGDAAKNLAHVPLQPGEAVTDYMSGVILCCNNPRLNGSVFSGADITSTVAAYRAQNLTVHATVSVVRPGPGQDPIQYLQSMHATIAQLTRWSTAQGVHGVLLDYEPSTDYSAAHATAYADFLIALGKSLHAAGLEVAADMASWGILDYYKTYAAASLDWVSTMSSWYQAGRGNYTWLVDNTNAILDAGFPPPAVHLGLSDQCKAPDSLCGWSPALLAQWSAYLASQQLGGLDVWTPDSPGNTAGWEWAAFKKLLSKSNSTRPLGSSIV